MKKLILSLAAFSLIASPAMAMGIRKADPATQPVPAGERDALYAEYNAFTACLGDPRYAQVRGAGELVKLETALNSAGNAAKNSNNAAFQTEAAIFRAELAALNLKYGC